MNSSKKRVPIFDVIRGIGIILVVLSHTTNALGKDTTRMVIFAFHMPLFFILSGVLSKYPNLCFRDYVKKNIYRYLIPYIFISIFDIILATIWGYDMKYIIDGIFFKNGHLIINIPIWYLLVFFNIQFIAYWILRQKRSIVFLIMVISIILTYYNRQIFPLGFHLVFPGLMFFLIGYLGKRVVDKLISVKLKYFVLFLFLIVPIFILSIWTNRQVNMFEMNYGTSFLLYILNGIFGSLIIFIVGKVLEKNRLLSFYGQNSIIILCLHYYFTKYLLIRIIDAWSFQRFLYHFETKLIFTIITMIIMIPVIIIYRKCLSVCREYKK